MTEQHKYLTFSAPLRLCARNQLTNLGLYMVLKWAGLRRGRLFSSQIRVAKGVSVYSVVNLPTKEPSRLILAWRIWYNSWRSAVARAVGGALIFDIGGRQTAPATGLKPLRTRAEARTSEYNGRGSPPYRFRGDLPFPLYIRSKGIKERRGKFI